MAIPVLKRKVQIIMYSRLPFVLKKKKKKQKEPICLFWIFVYIQKIFLSRN